MPPKKRNRAEAQAPQSGSRRRSVRLGSTGKKSSYFENQDDVDDSHDEDGPPRKTMKPTVNASRARSKPSIDSDDDAATADDDDGDQYEDSNVSDDEIEEIGEDEEEDDEDDYESATPPPPPKAKAKAKASTEKRGRGRPRKDSTVQPKTEKAGKKGKAPTEKKPSPALSRVRRATPNLNDSDRDDEDEDDDCLKEVFVPGPKLRDTNGIEYEDTRIHPNTLHFLGDLKANNLRSWLKENDKEFRRSLKDWESFVETLTDKIIDADATIPELPIKDLIFRICRDIRFSKDSTPYKPHYSAAWSRTGRKGPYACYYVHIEPGRCFVGGGLRHPDASALARLRASIDERPHRIRRVLTDPDFVRVFMPHVVGKKKGKILKAFAGKNKENALKTKPKGFNPEHRDIELLKLRNYTISCQMPDKDIFCDDPQEKIMRIIRAMVPFITFLNNVVMPDPDFDSNSEGEGNGVGKENEEVEDDEDDMEEDDDGDNK